MNSVFNRRQFIALTVFPVKSRPGARWGICFNLPGEMLYLNLAVWCSITSVSAGEAEMRIADLADGI